jgi:acyl-CoA thioester hydrolase
MDDAQRFNQNRYKHWITDQVRFSDLDPLGHVNNNAIGTYFENARADLYREITPLWPRGDQFFVLARTAIDFRRELHLPAQLRIGTGVVSVGRTSMLLINALFRGDEGLAYCESVSVFIDSITRKPTEIPQDLREVLQKYATDETAF